MDNTTNAERLMLAMNSLRSDAYICRKFGGELATIERLATTEQPGSSVQGEDWQQRCLDLGFKYWRAPDAHGVECTHEQARALLRDLLGVEVDFTTPPPAPAAEQGESINSTQIDSKLIGGQPEARGVEGMAGAYKCPTCGAPASKTEREGVYDMHDVYTYAPSAPEPVVVVGHGVAGLSAALAPDGGEGE